MILWMDLHLRQNTGPSSDARKLMAWQIQHRGWLRKRVPLIDIAGQGNTLLFIEDLLPETVPNR